MLMEKVHLITEVKTDPTKKSTTNCQTRSNQLTNKEDSIHVNKDHLNNINTKKKDSLLVDR
jgi:alpha-glucuronidase